MKITKIIMAEGALALLLLVGSCAAPVSLWDEAYKDEGSLSAPAMAAPVDDPQTLSGYSVLFKQ